MSWATCWRCCRRPIRWIQLSRRPTGARPAAALSVSSRTQTTSRYGAPGCKPAAGRAVLLMLSVRSAV